MTYCVAMNLAEGLVLVADSRTNAGVDHIGTYNILWQIEQARLLKLPHLYLGYWIGASPKMSYKAQFRPNEHLIGGRWVPDPAASAGTPDETP